MSSRASCGALVLAAGGGSRFVGTTHKLLTTVAGKAVVRHVLEAVATSGVSPIIVVTGAVALDLAKACVSSTTRGVCAEWREAQL